MRFLFPIATAALALTFTMACEPTDSAPDADSYARHLPDDRILVSMPVNSGDRAVGDLAESYLTTAQVTSDVNALIGAVLLTLDHVTDFEPTYSSEDDEFFWGPWSDGGLDPNETGMWVAYDSDADQYGWAIVQRPKTSDSDDDWVAIAAGEATPGETEDTGSGSFILDFDAIADLNPAETTRGVFASTYSLSETDVVAEAAFDGLSDGSGESIDAVYGYGQDLSGAGYMDLGYIADVNGEGTDETVVLRTRWTAEGAGRGDMVIFGGDIDPLAFVGTECWGSDFLVSFEESNFSPSEGDEASCAFDQAEWNDDAPEVES